MEYKLFVGDFPYSSWSLRGWLFFDAFGIPVEIEMAHLRTPAFAAMSDRMAPSRQVPALAISDGFHAPVIVWETMAIAETVHDHHPQAGLWPKGASARPVARSIASEMHAGFHALRAACPMNMRRAYAGFEPDETVRADLERMSRIWSHARSVATGEGPFLFGAFCAVDAFFAPVASRIATYGLQVSAEDAAYVDALLSHPSVRRWRAMAVADGHIQPHYERDFERRPDPHEPAVTGTAAGDEQVAANEFCPFTGQDIAPGCRVEVGARILGFGDPFTAAKVAADPHCWPEIASLLPRA